MSRVSVIVLNYNGKRFLTFCLDNLIRQNYGDITISVVDNGSSDGSVEFIKNQYPHLRLISLNSNLGFSKANNRIIRSGTEEYVALLNADAVPDLNWIQKLIEAMDEFPDAGFAASKMLYFHKPDIIDRAGDGYTRAGVGLLRGRGQHISNYQKKEWVFGACAGGAIYRRSMLNHIGLFDEDFFLLYEDVDLSFRAQLFGYQCIYVPEAMIFHMASESIGYDSPVSVYYSHRNLEWTYFQNMPKQLMLRSIHQHSFYIFLAFLFFSTKGLATPFLKAKIDALKGLKSTIKKRKEIQRNKSVTDRYIWSLLENEYYLPRLNRRLKKPARKVHDIYEGNRK